MKLKKLKKIKINTVVFYIKWDKKSHDGSFLFRRDRDWETPAELAGLQM